MNELFTIPESLSPRLAWIERHEIELFNYGKNCFVRCPHENAWGDTVDEALTQLALKLGVKLWNEE